MQPFQCDLQPQLQETHRTTHAGTTIVAKHIEGTKRPQAAPAAHKRYLSSPAAATSHGKAQGFVLRLPPYNTRHATFMQPFQCDLQPQLQETHRTTHTGPTIVTKHIEGTKRPQPHPPRTRGTFHRRLQPLYTEKRKVSCSGFLPTSPLAFVTASLPHHFPSSPPRFVTTSLPHHFPSSPLSFLTTPLPHHSPSSSLPFVTTSLRPLPFLTTSLPLHSPSSPLPFIITSLPIVPTSLPHHFPSSPLPFVTTFLRHHPVIITTLHQDQFQRFFFFCYVLLCVVLLCDLPPFIKVNSTASYSFVMYCYVMYCYVIYHPSSFQVSEFYLSVTRKYCFPTSFDHQYTPC